MAMHELVPRDAQGRSDYRLAVVRPHLAGLTHAQAEQLVADVAEQTGQLCEIVNHNLRGKQYAVAARSPPCRSSPSASVPGPPAGRPCSYVPGIDVPFHSRCCCARGGGVPQHLLDKLPLDVDAAALVGRYIPNLYPRLFRLDRDYVEGVPAVCDSPVLAELLARWDDEPDRRGSARILLIELLAWQFASPVRWIETFELACTPVSQGGPGDRADHRGRGGRRAHPGQPGQGLAAAPGHPPRQPALGGQRGARRRRGVRSQRATPHRQRRRRGTDEASPQPAAAPPPAAQALPRRGPEAAASVPDLPVDHATALAALLALRGSVRPDQLGGDTSSSSSTAPPAGATRCSWTSARNSGSLRSTAPTRPPAAAS